MSHVEGEITINRPVEDVFDFAADERNEPLYNPHMLQSELISEEPIGLGSRFHAVMSMRGKPVEMAIEFTAFERPRLLASSTHLSTMDIQGTLAFDPVPGGTRMRWFWELHPRGALKLIKPMVAWMGTRQERAIWTGLKRYLEGSEARAPQSPADPKSRNESQNKIVVHDANFGKWWFGLENSVLKLVLRTGLKFGTTYILSVKGRKTGAVHSTPVVLVELDGKRYLVAPYGPVNWVRNARAAGAVTLTRGRHSEALHIVEVKPQESAPILKHYVRIASAARSCFDAKPDAPVQEHPVFRLVA